MNKVDVTDVDMVKFVQKVYELSAPQGMGILHFTEGGLPEEAAKEIVDDWKGCPSMDYVGGRACKMDVLYEDGKKCIRVPWYDHTDVQLKELLAEFDIEYGVGEDDHGTACNCDICRGR